MAITDVIFRNAQRVRDVLATDRASCFCGSSTTGEFVNCVFPHCTAMNPSFPGVPAGTGRGIYWFLMAMGLLLGCTGLGQSREAGNRPPVISVWVNDKQVPVIEHWVGGRLNCTGWSMVA
jgi:hypothetical protein